MPKILERISGYASYELPASYSRQIGRIVVHWAYVEQCLQEMIWEALKISDAAGRKAVRDPRVTDRLDMLRDVIALRGGSVDEPLFKSIRARAELMAAKRHLLVHGIWFRDKTLGECHVQLARGSWPKTHAELIAGSKKVNPESVLMTLEELRGATSEIVELIADLKKLRASAVEPNPSLPETHP
jgi:hypothetical protein